MPDRSLLSRKGPMDRTDRSARFRTLLALGLLAIVVPAGGVGCATMGLDRGKALVPTGYQTRTGPFLVCTNSRLEPDAPVIRQLHALETQVGDTLGLHAEVAEHPIEIYLLDDRQAFDHFLQFHYPDLPRRRAFFLANGKQRVVYTFRGERTEEDVRHEATHALLHVAVGDMPLWLDEGLAEYFEGPQAGAPRAMAGVNAEHLDRLPADLKAGWTPDLRRLESLRAVRQMSPRDYRESWAWVHYFLNDSRASKAALLAYLGDLRSAVDPPPMSARLDDVAAAPLLAHLQQVREQPVATSVPVAPRDPTVRLQSAQVEHPVAIPSPGDAAGRADDEPAAAPAGARRRSLIGRLFGWFGP